MRKALAAVALTLSSAAPQTVLADTPVSGPITTNTTWTLANSPYVVTGSINVDGSSSFVPTLTIEAGVVVKFNQGTHLDIGYWGPARLVAIGTAGQPIRLTSNQATLTPGYWRGIFFDGANTPSSQLSHVFVEGGGSANEGGLVVRRGSPSLDHVTVQTSKNAAVQVLAGTPSIASSTLTATTGGDGVGVDLFSGVTLTMADTAITNNAGAAIARRSNVTLQGMAGLTVTGNGLDAVRYRGTSIASNETWTSFGLPYVLDASLTVDGSAAAAAVLTIEPGVVVKFNQGTHLDIGYWSPARLVANGTPEQPIRFTSNQATVTPGHWRGILFDRANTPSSQLSYAIVEGAGSANEAGLIARAGSPSFDHVTVQMNKNAGVVVSGGSPSFDHLTVTNNAGYGIMTRASSPSFDHVTITNSSAAGLYVLENASPRLVNCAFVSNAGGAINNATPATLVSALLSYWGAAGGPSGNGPGSGQSVTGGVRWEPWLTQAPSSPNFFSSVILENRRFRRGSGQNARWTFQSALGGDWTLSVLGSSQVVRTFTGTGTSGVVEWDGRNNSGAEEPEGRYSYRIDTTDGANAASTVTGFVYLIHTPRVAIDSPTSGALLSSFFQDWVTTVPVTGSAAIDNLVRWTLEVGRGSAPSSWTTLATGTSPVSHVTLATWATGALPNDTYVLRLTAIDNQAFADTVSVPVVVGNFNLTQDVRDFDARSGGFVTYRSTVPFDMTERLTIRNEANQVVRTLFNGARSAGDYLDAWDGRSDSGRMIANGLYRYVAELTAGSQVRIWDLTAQTDPGWGWEFGLHVSVIPVGDPFDNSPTEITYSIARPGRVYVAIAASYPINEQPCPSNTCWSIWQGAGTHTFRWAGVDRSGALRQDIRYVAVVSNFGNPFPLNGVVLFGANPILGALTVTPPVFRPLEAPLVLTLPLSTYQGQSATVTATFRNQQSLSILRTITGVGTPPSVSLQWDGRSDGGMLVAPGVYTITVTVIDGAGNQASEQILAQVRY